MRFTCRGGHTWKSQRFRPEPWERICPTCQLPAEASLKSSTGTTKLHAESPAEQRARERFGEIVTAFPCFFYTDRRGHRCYGKLDAHHLIPADYLRRTYADLPESDLLDILYAPIIGAPLCRDAHDAIERRSEFIHYEELEPELIEFCQRVDEKYPGYPSMLGRLELESPRREAA